LVGVSVPVAETMGVWRRLQCAVMELGAKHVWLKQWEIQRGLSRDSIGMASSGCSNALIK